MPLTLVVASTVVDRARRLERGRVDNIWRLLAEFGALRVERLVIESRQEWNDRHDRREIEQARRSGVCTHAMTYCHRRPPEDPMLWVADAVAGAASAHLFGVTSEFWTRGPRPEHVRQRWPRIAPEMRQARGPVFRRGSRASLPWADRP